MIFLFLIIVIDSAGVSRDALWSFTYPLLGDIHQKNEEKINKTKSVCIAHLLTGAWSDPSVQSLFKDNPGRPETYSVD